MTQELPVVTGKNAMHRDGITQVVFYPGAIFTAFEEWLAEKGLELTPPMVFSEDPLEVPTRFVALTNESVSKLGQSDE
jgi:hypothetical protein